MSIPAIKFPPLPGLLLIIQLVFFPNSAILAADELTLAEVTTHLRFLASDELAGRQPGTAGGRVAARYIAEYLRSVGLKYFNDTPDYFQTAELKVKIKDINSDSTIEKKILSRNVVGYVEGTDRILKNEFLLLSAHYDHLGIKPPLKAGTDSIYNGAIDNGMGVVSLLAAAKVIAANPTKRSVIFLATTGEESGMLGSRYFAANSPVPLGKIRFNLNNDNAGMNDTTLIRIIGLERISDSKMITLAVEPFHLKCLPWPEQFQYLYNRTDNIAFAEQGIPGITFSAGFSEIDQEMVKYVHTPFDEANDTFNYSYLLNFAKAYVQTAVLLANGKQLPFWKKGDPFEEMGVNLLND